MNKWKCPDCKQTFKRYLDLERHKCPSSREKVDIYAAIRRKPEEAMRILSEMLGAAEVDCLDDKSNVWRSLMIDARAITEQYRKNGR